MEHLSKLKLINNVCLCSLSSLQLTTVCAWKKLHSEYIVAQDKPLAFSLSLSIVYQTLTSSLVSLDKADSEPSHLLNDYALPI